jgi:ribosome-binding protein aMBF1 (putative translation factor)
MTATELAELRIAAVKALKEALTRGVDAADLAREIGKKPEAIGRYIAGQNLPTPRTARRILKAVGV